MTEPIDQGLRDLLRPAAAKAMAEWCEMMGVGLRLDRVFVNGRSTATVATVFESSPGRMARKMVLKHDIVSDHDLGSAEYRRHEDALRDAREFQAHLTPLIHEPIRIGDGTWIMFQKLAGDSLADTRVLTSLLAAVPGVRLSDVRTDNVPGDGKAFVDTCSAIVRSIVADWVGAAGIESMTASAFVRRHIADRAAPGKPLAELIHRFPGESITLDGESGPLPNPFAFLRDRPPTTLDVEIQALVGKGHGDLHPENVLIGRDVDQFWLIDLTRYRADAPVTQDPVQLVLAVINRTMGGLTDDERAALLDVLTAPGTSEPWLRLPGWLSALIRDTRTTCLDWLAPSGLGDEWRRATLLSTVACSLIFAARGTTPAVNRTWFLRLAARATHAYVAAAHGRPADPPPPTERRLSAAPATGLAQLCVTLWDLRAQATDDGLADTVERLVTRGRLGHDITDELEWLLDTLSVGRRSMFTSFAEVPPTIEQFRCPLLPVCGRTDHRPPGGPEPFCHVADESMKRLIRSL